MSAGGAGGGLADALARLSLAAALYLFVLAHASFVLALGLLTDHPALIGWASFVGMAATLVWVAYQETRPA